MVADSCSHSELAELFKEVRRIEVQSRRLVAGVIAGGYRSIFGGAGIEFDEVREYVEGDDPRTVDWNVTARVGRPFVKKFIDEREHTLLFLQDLSASMSGGAGAWSPRQTAARVVACLALAAVEHHDRVGLIAFGQAVESWVPARMGLGHALRIVRDCLALPATSGATDLAPALDLAARAVRRRAIVFVLSDFLTTGWQQPLARCARRHDVIAVRLLLPDLVPERVTHERGLVHVRDPESGAEALLDWSHSPTRAAYQQRIAEWRQRIEVELRRAGVDRVDVVVPRVARRDAIARPLLELFRVRELRGMKR